jgi:hypothetical protein
VPIIADEQLSALFDVRAPYVTIKDLFVYSDIDAAAPYFSAFVIAPSGSTCTKTMVQNNIVFVGTIFEDESGTAHDSVISENRHEAAGSDSPIISVTSDRVNIRDNTIKGTATDGITLAAGASECIVRGNHLNAGPIDSSASDGTNVIHGNTDVGTITPHATDAVGSNT